ncbi:unnamed protein product, partial [Brugia pahangi]|uniref:Nuclear receptor domain-containing protein n=1 Tax=Brugia pahangi TaxID=6280 RepID=A0A0N4T8D8_BRUPA
FSYPLLSFDISNTLSALSITQQSAPRTICSVITKKTGEQLCQICLYAASNGSHFGAKTCAACAAFFRRTVSDEKNYICKRSQRCDVKLTYAYDNRIFLNFNYPIYIEISATGYRKICRSCRMKRCLHIGMLPESKQLCK